MGQQPIGANEPEVPAGIVGPLPNAPQPPAKPDAPEPPERLFDAEQQLVVNRIVTKAAQDAVAVAQAEWQGEQTKREATALRAGLKEQQKYQELARNLENELEGYTDDGGAYHEGLRATAARLQREVDELSGDITEEFTAALATLPPFIKGFAPEESATASAKRKWLKQAMEAAQQAGVIVANGPTIPGIGPSPFPTKPAEPNKPDPEAEVQRAKASPAYSRF